jgi:predicted O-methyltransferase YrrM
LNLTEGLEAERNTTDGHNQEIAETKQKIDRLNGYLKNELGKNIESIEKGLLSLTEGRNKEIAETKQEIDRLNGYLKNELGENIESIEKGLLSLTEGLEAERNTTDGHNQEIAETKQEIDRLNGYLKNELGENIESIEKGLLSVTEGLEAERNTTDGQNKEINGTKSDIEKIKKLQKVIMVNYNDILDLYNRLKGKIEEKELVPLNNNTLNITKAQVHQRILLQEELERLFNYWTPKFGLKYSKRAIAYTAHKICLLEDKLHGRLATTITAVLLRLFALQSIKKKDIKVLEIGALFGLNTIILNEFTKNDNNNLHFTLIDPLRGYYAEDHLDPQSGVPVDRNTIEKNLALAGFKKNQYRIIEGFSQKPSVYELVKKEKFDYILLDGDHSYEGVLEDYKIYSPHLQANGILVFDDYDTKEWPDIKRVVDVVKNEDKDLHWLGGEWRTGMFINNRK